MAAQDAEANAASMYVTAMADPRGACHPTGTPMGRHAHEGQRPAIYTTLKCLPVSRWSYLHGVWLQSQQCQMPAGAGDSRERAHEVNAQQCTLL